MLKSYLSEYKRNSWFLISPGYFFCVIVISYILIIFSVKKLGRETCIISITYRIRFALTVNCWLARGRGFDVN